MQKNFWQPADYANLADFYVFLPICFAATLAQQLQQYAKGSCEL